MTFLSGLRAKLWYRQVLALRRTASAMDLMAHRAEMRYPFTQEERHVMRRNARFLRRHLGMRAFIIGNGPSIKEQDLSPLKDEITFTCNAFFLHPILSQWQPTYHSNIDDTLFDGTEEIWFEENCRKMPSTTFFAPMKWRRSILEKKQLPEERTFFCAFAGEMNNDVQSVDVTNPLPGVQSVSLLGIVLAMYMGCAPIYLLGMDHDWLTGRTADTHFYPHRGFVVDGMTLSADLSKVPYDVDLEAMLRLWKGYRNLKMHAEANGFSIFNTTHGGFLDVFERVRYESLFEESKRKNQ